MLNGKLLREKSKQLWSNLRLNWNCKQKLNVKDFNLFRLFFRKKHKSTKENFEKNEKKQN